ncbi:hypothetical protein J437_LFUL019275 [Ladona fulva]|uniref:c-SKI SMAD4-binding domain-containing protein n=1 Tax=Ladona fulva TaxID=123851 RepID=A0A8K0P858_LADFU|nr:hypothetical protein J437_LFUL019275 [Ladona fulva]
MESAAVESRVIPAASRVTVHALSESADEEMKGTSDEASADPTTAAPKPNQVGTVLLYGIPIVSLVIDSTERLCLAQISNTLLRDFSYNEIHNRRVALGITCVQCTPVQLEILRRAGAMPVSSRRCGMITRREAERLCRSFLGDNSPPRLPDHFAFDVVHSCAWGCRGAFLPSRYNSSRAKCIRCSYCRSFFSPNKFIFHSHRLPDSEYVQPDAANFNSWRRHLSLAGNPAEEVIHAWEDVKAMFNGGTRKRMLSAATSGVSSSADGSGGSRRSEQKKISQHSSSNEETRPAPPPPPGAAIPSYLRPDKPRTEFPLCRTQNQGPPSSELSSFVHLSPLPPPPPFPESALHPPPPPSIHYDLHRSFVDYVWSRQHCAQGGRGKPEAGFTPFSPYSLPWFKRPILPFPSQNAPEAPHSPIVLPPPPPGALTERPLQDSPPSPALPHHHPIPAPFHPRSPAPAAVISNLYASAFRPVGGASRREEEEGRGEEAKRGEEEEEEETVDIETTEEDEEAWRRGREEEANKQEEARRSPEEQKSKTHMTNG